jgi:integrase
MLPYLQRLHVNGNPFTFSINSKTRRFFNYCIGEFSIDKHTSSFSRRYKDIRDKKELKKIRFHDLRHTNATIM